MPDRDRLPQLSAERPFVTDGGLETTLIFQRGLVLPIVLDTPTWRANPGWAARLGYSPAELDRANREAVDLLDDIRASAPAGGPPIVISGAIGPQGDGYSPVKTMSAGDAERYHAVQIGSFRRTAADLVTAFTITYADEAIGIVRAARAAGMPVVIGFTVETDGRLPDGTRLRDAIEGVDAATGGAAAYFMVN